MCIRDSAGTYWLLIFDINGFSVTNPSDAYLGLSAPSEYLDFNQGCQLVIPMEITEPAPAEPINTQIIHPCSIFENVDSLGNFYTVDPANGVLTFNVSGDNPPFELTLSNLENYIVENDSIIVPVLDTVLVTNSDIAQFTDCLLYTSPSPRDGLLSRMPSSA